MTEVVRVAHEPRDDLHLRLRGLVRAQREEVRPLGARHHDRVPREGLQDSVRVLLVHICVQERLGSANRILRRLQPYGPCVVLRDFVDVLCCLHACSVLAERFRHERVLLHLLDALFHRDGSGACAVAREHAMRVELREQEARHDDFHRRKPHIVFVRGVCRRRLRNAVCQDLHCVHYSLLIFLSRVFSCSGLS